jgi:Domain of unknown function (DUF6754)
MPPELDTRWFDPARINVLAGILLFVGFLVINIARARGSALFIRPIAGLQALDEAIGRATEMGRPVLYVPGLSDMSEVGTFAAITIFHRVAKKAAEVGCGIEAPCYDPVVAAVMDEAAKTAYREASRPDAYRPGTVHYVSAQQFAYVAAVNGYMLRERPAANIYMGSFYAESLLLAETGNSTGAIQIAGTDKVTQLPFFICACDYTLLGEELYAASAYIGREPIQMATIAAQDWAKAAAAAVVLAALLLLLAGHPELLAALQVS